MEMANAGTCARTERPLPLYRMFGAGGGRQRGEADLLDHVQDKHGSRQADIVLAIVRKLMNWYTSRNDDYPKRVGAKLSGHTYDARPRPRLLAPA